MDSEEQIFYMKVTQLKLNTAEYKYEVVFVLDPSSIIPNATEATSENGKGITPPCLADNTNSDNDNISPPVKRSLFQTSTE